MSQQRVTVALGVLAVVGLVAGGAFYLMRETETPSTPPTTTGRTVVPEPAKAPPSVTAAGATPLPSVPVVKEAYNPAFDPRNARDELSIGGFVQTADSTGVENATVELLLDTSAVVSRAMEAELRGTCLTLNNGQFYFSPATCQSCGLSYHERYVLRVSHPNFATERVIGVEVRDPRSQNRTIVLSPAANRATGVVRNREGAPIPGAVVKVYDLNAGSSDPDGAVERTGTSGEDGAYVVSNLKPGLKKVWVSKAGYASTGRPTQNFEAANPEVRIDFTMRPGFAIAGMIASQENGLGVSGAYVTVKPTRLGVAAELAEVAKGRSSPTGLREKGTRSGEEALKAAERRRLAAEDQAKRLENARSKLDGRMKREEQEREPEPKRIHSSDDDGAPEVDDAAARLAQQEATQIQQNMHLTSLSFRSEADGRFRAEGLEAGTYQITVTAAGFAPPPVQSADTGAEGVNFDLVPNARILGRCVDDQTGRPIPSFTVGLGSTYEQNSVPHHLRRSFSAPKYPDGTFEYVDVRPGNYFLIAEAPGYAGGRSNQVTVGQADKREGVEIRMVKGATIVGRVMDSQNKPVADATVSLEVPATNDPGGLFMSLIAKQLRRDVKEARTGSDGTFRLENVLDGKFALKVRHPDYGPFDDVGSFEVGKGGEITRPDVILRRGASVFGRVVKPDGAPDPQAMIQIAPVGAGGMGGANQRQAATDADGRYEVRGLTPGEYQVILAQRGGVIDLGSLIMQAQANAVRNGTAPVSGGSSLPMPKTYMLAEGQSLQVDF
jgi:protocatechuate 3,4-dioxygenase beta subunit